MATVRLYDSQTDASQILVWEWYRLPILIVYLMPS